MKKTQKRNTNQENQKERTDDDKITTNPILINPYYNKNPQNDTASSVPQNYTNTKPLDIMTQIVKKFKGSNMNTFYLKYGTNPPHQQRRFNFFSPNQDNPL